MMLIFNWGWGISASTRAMWALAFMGFFKIQFQNHLQELGRIPGHLYVDPGVYSFTTNYHDVNDYYYSGHMCWALIGLNEFRIGNDKAGVYLMIFQTFYTFYLMLVTHSHYFIDFPTSFGIVWLGLRYSERYISYIFDVKMFGMRGEVRR